MRVPIRLIVVLAMLASGALLAPAATAVSRVSSTAATSVSAPDARNDRAAVLAGGAVTVPVLSNDTCFGRTPCRARKAKLSILKSSIPAHVHPVVRKDMGKITVHVDDIRKAGDFSIRYVLTTKGGHSDTARISVAVTYPRYSPLHYTPAYGARFNNPQGTQAERRSIIRNVVRTIDSVPGYRVKSMRQCPTQASKAPNEIKVSLYSIADRSFVNALIRAARRCVSVQLLMNAHLDATTSPSWGALLHVVGNHRHARSFTYRCKGSCRGHGVLHAKFYLFSRAGKKKDVVMVGSSNMTTNAAHVQWNDLYTTSGHSTLYGQFRSVFEEMVPDKSVKNPLRVYNAGRYQTVFWPQPGATDKTDEVMRDLRSIKCSGATGGTGINGHTAVYINIHAWHSAPRGQYLAQEVRSLWARGCYVHVLYSFMGHGIFNYLKQGTGARMVVLRTLFPHPDTDVAEIYSHMKNIAVSGNVAGDSSNWVTWTGSNNFTNMGVHSDEVMIRIPSRYVFRQYRNHWNFIAKTRSSPYWAIYSEPSGGGRAPDEAGRLGAVANGGRSGTAAAHAPAPRSRSVLPQVDTTGQDMD